MENIPQKKENEQKKRKCPDLSFIIINLINEISVLILGLLSAIVSFLKEINNGYKVLSYALFIFGIIVSTLQLFKIVLFIKFRNAYYLFPYITSLNKILKNKNHFLYEEFKLALFEIKKIMKEEAILNKY